MQSLTVKDLADSLGVTPQAVRKRAAANKWMFTEEAVQGGRRRLYSFESLPEDVKSAVRVRQAREQGDQAAISPADTAPIPDNAHQAGLDRYQLVHAWLAHLKKQKKQKKSTATKAFLTAYNSALLLPEVHERLGTVSQQTLYRWRKQLDDAGDDYRALCDRRGAWTKGGRKGLGQVGREAEEVFLQCWLQPNKPSVKLAYEAASAVLKKRGMQPASYYSFKRFADRFDRNHHDLVVLKREGEKALKDKVGPFITRADKILHVGDVIFADGKVLNFTCKHPETGKPHRPTLITWFDWRSRMPVGWEIMPTEDTVAISSALRMAILTLGKLPRVAYIDNGKAFRAKYFSNSNGDIEALQGLYARMGVAVQYSRPYEARTKIVERFFRSFQDQCERLLPSFTGASIEDKPAHLHRNELYHQARRNDWTPTLADAAEIFRLYVNWYGGQPHRGLGGELPAVALQAGLGDGIDSAELNRFFLFSKKVTPRRCRFTIAGITYESDVLYGLNQEVIVKYSWSDMSEAYLYTMDGQSLGEARPVEAIHPLAKHFGDELDYLKVKEANKRQRQLKSKTLSLARELDGEAEGLTALPWMQRAKQPLRIVPQKKQTAPEPEISEADRTRLEAKQAALESGSTQRPTYTPPAFFASKLDRFEFLFRTSVIEGHRLTPDDADFVSRYEASDDFNRVRDRFEQLRRVYALQTQEGQG